MALMQPEFDKFGAHQNCALKVNPEDAESWHPIPRRADTWRTAKNNWASINGSNSVLLPAIFLKRKSDKALLRFCKAR